MGSKVNQLKLAFYLPVFVAAVRIIMTLATMIMNPLHMSLRFIQVVPLVAYTVYTFLYYKLYSDNVPIITLMLPSILHFALNFAMFTRVELAAFVPLWIVDVVYIIVRSIKSSMFPFEIEGEEETVTEFEEIDIGEN